MTRRFHAGALAAALLAAGAAPSAAAPEDDYVALMTAVEIDRACVALKYIESAATRGAAFDYLRQTGQWAHMQDGRMSQEDYDAWEAALDQKARDAAAAVGCTEQALPAILTARAKAAEELYTGLYFAFLFDALDDDVYRRPLDDYEKQAAAGYDAYLQQLYGESFPTFVAYQQEQARAKLPQAVLDAMAPPPGSGTDEELFEDLYDPFDMLLLSMEDSSLVTDAQGTAIYAMNQVQFEVTAEVNGYLVRPLVLGDGSVIPELRRPADTAGWPVIQGPTSLLIDTTPENADDVEASWQDLFWVAALRPDGGLRVMFYGQTAQALAGPVVRIYAPNQPLPEGTYAWESFDRPEFRDTATAYDPVPATESCLGGPCFDFAPEVTDALLAHQRDNLAELFVATTDGAPYPFSFRQGRLGAEYLWRLQKGAE